MSQVTATRTVVVANYAGLHARAATLIAKQARRFDARVELIRDRQRVEATDVLQILSLGAHAGVQIGLEATGPDAEPALDALVQLFNDKFGE
jgi:phosphotransferase system HPr (HPr) family protein